MGSTLSGTIGFDWNCVILAGVNGVAILIYFFCSMEEVYYFVREKPGYQPVVAIHVQEDMKTELKFTVNESE